MDKTCGNCTFWRLSGQAGNPPKRGECRRYAPRPSKDDNRIVWPPTNIGDGCGEWERDKALPPPATT